MTRILSVFNVLRRVGFVFLLLNVLNPSAHAAWDTDPANPTFNWGDLREGNIVSDGLGGAFFSVGSYDFTPWQRVGHVNADGEFTFVGTAPPWEGLLLADEPGYGSTLDGLTLVPSEPPGTIIACDYRFDPNGEYIGSAFFKFDTLGFTGFERVVIEDSTHGLTSTNDGPSGQRTAISDGQGGIHFCLDTSAPGLPPFYYNHLRSDGTFTYPLPGLEVPGPFLRPDGYGGVFLIFRTHPTWEQWGLRFDADGVQQWQEPRYLIREMGNSGGQTLLLSPGRLLVTRDSLLGNNQFAHYIFLLDTAGNHIWDPQGIRIAEDFLGQMVSDAHFVPDGQGGFFNNRYRAPGPAQSFHFNADGQIIANNENERWILRADGQGGGYNALQFGSGNTLSSTVWRYDAELIRIWEDSVVALQQNLSYWGGDYIAAENNGIIGIVHTIPGVVFYHVNPDGSLGPRLSARDHRPVSPKQIEILSAYPNPFNSTLSISLEIPLHQDVTLSLYDLLGREVDVVYRGRLSSSTISYVAPAELASGVYFLRAVSGEQSELVKVVLLK